MISIEKINKNFGTVQALKDVSLEIGNGKKVVIIGPSGSGKSTLIRCINGLEKPTSGKITVDGLEATAPKADMRRLCHDVAMVFQNFNLYPHKTVLENVTLAPIKVLKIPRDKAVENGKLYLDRVGLSDKLDTYPAKLSGGQQQRVALARAIVIHPEVLLMDEPLSNLDAKLRVEMRNAIKRIQQQVGITTLYVTHDQEEALAVSDRIAVMNGGVIQQIDTPKNIYQRPANLFVSTFIGLSNIMDGTVDMSQGGTRVRIGDYSVAMDNLDDAVFQGQPVKVSVRPEEFIISRSSQEGIPAIVRSSVFLGVTTHYFVESEDGREMEVIQNSDIWDIIPDHTPVRLGVQPAKINVFNQEGTKSLIVRREHA